MRQWTIKNQSQNMVHENFNTPRLTLEKVQPEDSFFIMELVNSEGWIKYIGDRNIHSNEDALQYIKKILENSNTTYWVVKLKANAVRLGVITLIKRDYLDFYDIGFAFLPQYESKGYAYESAKAVLDFITKSTSIPVVLAITSPENIRSIKLIQRLGLSFLEEKEEGTDTLSVYKMDIDREKNS